MFTDLASDVASAGLLHRFRSRWCREADLQHGPDCRVGPRGPAEDNRFAGRYLAWSSPGSHCAVHLALGSVSLSYMVLTVCRQKERQEELREVKEDNEEAIVKQATAAPLLWTAAVVLVATSSTSLDAPRTQPVKVLSVMPV